MSPTKSTAVLATVAIFSLIAAPSREAAAPQNGIHPIIDARSGMLFGGIINSKWVDAEHLAPRLKGGERYRLYGFTQTLGESVGDKPDTQVEDCGSPQIGLKPSRSGALLAIAGAWNALPRRPRLQSVTQPIYRQAVHAFLPKRGVRSPQFSIKQIVRCDLDGNGQDQVLISVDQQTNSGTKGLLLLRKIVRGRVRTIPIAAVIPYDLPSSTRLVALLDVNGDGRMDIITETHAPDSVSQEIWQVDEAKPRLVLNWGCGA